MSDLEQAQILFVDDEADLLAAIVRTLRKYPFRMSTADNPSRALEMLANNGPYAVIVSDLRMPGMDGVALLGRARELAPDTVRILFTGQPDLEHAISAVNKGAIFRFVTKPCPPLLLAATIESAVEQHRLITAERVLLEQTLNGSIQALCEILALTNPMAFGRGTRIRSASSALASSLGIQQTWEVEVAAMLSQIGHVILPPATLERVYKGETLAADEQIMLERMPAVIEQILGNIPRIEGVREILKYHQKRFNGTGPPIDHALAGDGIPLGARVLNVVLAFDVLERQGVTGSLACDTLRGRKGWYDPAVVEALTSSQATAQRHEIRELPLSKLHPGMVFAQDVWTDRGLLVVTSGQEVTPHLLDRLANFSKRLTAPDSLRMIIPDTLFLPNRR